MISTIKAISSTIMSATLLPYFRCEDDQLELEEVIQDEGSQKLPDVHEIPRGLFLHQLLTALESFVKN